MQFELRKELKKVYVFQPEGENYIVYPEGREISYQGDKLHILYMMTKKFPRLKNAMAFLMDNEVPFFYDPFFDSFRTFKKGCDKEYRNRSISSYFHAITPHIMAYNAGIKEQRTNVRDIDTFSINPYISRIRYNDKTVLEEESSKYLQLFTEELKEKKTE